MFGPSLGHQTILLSFLYFLKYKKLLCGYPMATRKLKKIFTRALSKFISKLWLTFTEIFQYSWSFSKFFLQTLIYYLLFYTINAKKKSLTFYPACFTKQSGFAERHFSQHPRPFAEYSGVLPPKLSTSVGLKWTKKFSIIYGVPMQVKFTWELKSLLQKSHVTVSVKYKRP